MTDLTAGDRVSSMTLVELLRERVAEDDTERMWRALETPPVDPWELALAAVGPPVEVPIIPGR